MARRLSTYGFYPSVSALHTGVEALKGAGFRQTDISVLYSDEPQAHQSRYGRAGSTDEPTTTIGVLLAYLAGIGAVTVPGAGAMLAAGPILGAFAGANGSASLAGTFTGLGLPADRARNYEGRLLDGGVLVSVHCDDGAWVDLAHVVLEQTGAEHVAFAEKDVAYQ